MNTFFLAAFLALRLLNFDDPAPNPNPPQPNPNPVITIVVKGPASASGGYDGNVGDFIELQANTNGKEVKWFTTDKNLHVFPADLLKDSKTNVVVSNVAGSYTVYAYTALNDLPSEIASQTIIVGAPTPQPVPNPPNPNPVPNPPNPVPQPGKVSVLFLDNVNDMGSADYKQYLAVLNSTKVRAYLNQHCDKDQYANGKSGPSWRRWDITTDVSHENAKWQNIFVNAKKQTNLPAIVIADSNTGNTVYYSGKVPTTETDLLALLQKYAGN